MPSASSKSSLFPDSLAWYVVHTRTKAEHVAAGMMQNVLSIPTYCPRIKFQRSTARGKVWFIEALFPSYFFAQFNPAQSLRAVRSAQSVLNVLEFGGTLAHVSDEVIATLREEMAGQDIKEILTPLQPGDSVLIAEGPMRGFQGIVHSLRTGEDRVRVLMDFLGSQHPVEMPTHTVLSPRSARSVLAENASRPN